jgi:hypothetical protein
VVGRSSQTFPVAAQALDGVLGLRHHLQRVVLADRDAQGAALAGVRIDGDREQAAAALGLLFAIRPVGLGRCELEAAELDLQLGEFGGEAGTIGFRRVGQITSSMARSISGRTEAALAIDQRAQLLLDGARRGAGSASACR